MIPLCVSPLSSGPSVTPPPGSLREDSERLFVTLSGNLWFSTLEARSQRQP